MHSEQFYVPESLITSVDEYVLVAREDLAAQKLDDFWSSMPDSTKPKNDAQAEFVDMAPFDDHDRTSAVVLPLPFANGWAPHMALRAFLLQDSLKDPTRVIVFPNEAKSYSLTKQEQATVASGNFEPIAEKQLESLRQLGIDTLQFVGYSMGATIGACALKLAAKTDSFLLGHSGLFEPPNVIGRSPGQLRKDFIKSGKGLDKAVNDSGVPALSEAQKSRGGLDVIRKYAGLAPLVVASQLPTNKAVHKGFTYPHFLRDLSMAMRQDSEFDTLIAAAEDSLITPVEFRDDVSEIAHENPRLRLVTVEDYGHEMGDNIVVHAILAKLALKAA